MPADRRPRGTAGRSREPTAGHHQQERNRYSLSEPMRQLEQEAQKHSAALRNLKRQIRAQRKQELKEAEEKVRQLQAKVAQDEELYGSSEAEDSTMDIDEEEQQDLATNDIVPVKLEANNDAYQPTAARSWRPTAVADIPKPCDWTREELMNNEDFRSTIEEGTLPASGFIVAHHHVRNVLGSDWNDETQPPPGSFKARRIGNKIQGAWRCTRSHASGDYYMPSCRKTCEACGQGRNKGKFETMSWDLTYDNKTGKGSSYVLFRKNTGFVPSYSSSVRDESKSVRRNGKHKTYYPSRLCALMCAQFPSLSSEDLRPYWSRPLVIEDFDEAERLLNIVRMQKGRNSVGNGVHMEFEGDRVVFVIENDQE